MIKIIKERESKTIVEHWIVFNYLDDPTSGYMFPATKEGNPDFSKMCPEAPENYHRCLTDKTLTEPEFETETRRFTEPAVGQCVCGREVVLESDFMGAVRCECGKWYNAFGQELVDPKYWEEDY